VAEEPCPPREELLAFTLGQLPDEAVGRVTDHLDRCPTCQRAVEVLDWTDDAVTATLRKPLPVEPFLDEPECRDLLLRAEAIVTPPPAASADPPPAPPQPSRFRRRLLWAAILAAMAAGGVLTVVAGWRVAGIP
jgi:anti-sigma factor RsiW